MKISKNMLKVIIILILFIISIFLIFVNYFDIQRKNATDNIIEDANNLNSAMSFSLTSASFYSSAYANNEKVQGQSIYLNLYQYTDIALNLSSLGDFDVEKIYIDNFSENIFYYKNLYDFGKYAEKDFVDKIEYEVIDTSQELDFSKPQIYKDLSNPITFEVSRLIAENKEITNVEKITHNGSLLKTAGIKLSDIANKVSFKLHVITSDSSEHSVQVTLNVPLSNSSSSIYDSSFYEEDFINTKF